MGAILGKWCLMHVRKVLSKISLCSPHRLIRDNTFRFYGIFLFKVTSNWGETLHTLIKPSYPKTMLILFLQVRQRVLLYKTPVKCQWQGREYCTEQRERTPASKWTPAGWVAMWKWMYQVGDVMHFHINWMFKNVLP